MDLILERRVLQQGARSKLGSPLLQRMFPPFFPTAPFLSVNPGGLADLAEVSPLEELSAEVMIKAFKQEA